QFERQGYFWPDPVDSKPGALVFNRIVSLRDSWAKKSAPRPAEAARSEAARSEAARSEAARPAPRPTPPPPAAPERDPREDLTPEARSRCTYLTDELGLSLDEALVLAVDAPLYAFFEAARAAHDNARTVANWVVNELRREAKGTAPGALPFTAARLGRLVALVDDNTLSHGIAREVLAEMMASGGDPEAIVDARGLRQVSDVDALAPVVDRVLAAYPDKVEQYRGGKTGLMGFFVGQVMRETQ